MAQSVTQWGRAAFLRTKTTFASTPPTPGKGHDPAPQHAFEIRQIAGDHAQPVIVKTQHMLDRLHLGMAETARSKSSRLTRP